MGFSAITRRVLAWSQSMSKMARLYNFGVGFRYAIQGGPESSQHRRVRL